MLLLGDGKQRPPHSAFTRPCVFHTVFVRVHHPEVKGDKKSVLPMVPLEKETGGAGEVYRCLNGQPVFVAA